MRPINKFTESMLILMLSTLFPGCDFIEEKFDSMRNRIEQGFSNSAKGDIAGRTSDGAVLVQPEPEAEPALLDKACVTNGMAENELIEIMGKPNGEVLLNGRRLLVFNGGQVDVTDGFVTNLTSHFVMDVQTSREKSAKWELFRTQQEAKGLVLYEGAWVTPSGREKLEGSKAKQIAENKAKRDAEQRGKQQAEMIKKKALEEFNRAAVEYNGKGLPINYSEFITLGKITVVDFYATWCQPCREISPLLKALARDDQDIVLKRVNIFAWKSQTAMQYNVTSVPKVLVFDRKGRLVAPPDSSIYNIRKYVENAKNREY